MNPRGKHIFVFGLGISDFTSAWELQKKIFQKRLEGHVTDILLLTEHHHVYTHGKNSDSNHLLANREELQQRNAEVLFTDRGGGITYHGPGQLVGYPIINLQQYDNDVHRYLRNIEESIMVTLAEFGIHGKRESGYTGVWVGGDKIAAIGVKVSHGITMHGVALNVTTDLSYFNRIIPCGIFHRGVTSMKNLLGLDLPISEVSNVFIKKFGEVFGMKPVISSLPIEEYLHHVQNENVECQL